MLAVGGPNYARTELLNLNNWSWDFSTPYPNNGQVNSAKVIFHKNAYYVFGAIVDGFSNDEIMKFDLNVWSKVGRLNSKRLKYSVSFFGEKVYIVGGTGNSTIEIYDFRSTINFKHVGSTEIDNLENPTLFGFEQQECTALSSYKKEEEKLFVIFASPRPVFAKPQTTSKPTSRTTTSTLTSNNSTSNNLALVSSAKSTEQTTIKTTRKVKRREVHQNSTILANITTQAVSNATVKTTVNKITNMSSSTTTNLLNSSTKLGNASLVSTTQMTSKSTTKLFGVKKEKISPTPYQALTFTKFSDDNLVGSPYMIKMSGYYMRTILKQSCPVNHKGELFLYGGKYTSKKRLIYRFNVLNQKIEELSKLNFDFVDGVCASNNNLIFLCFASQDIRQCYKSLSPTPDKWWHKFILAGKSSFAHKSADISMSSGEIILFE